MSISRWQNRNRTGFETLEDRRLLAADVRITEFMAANESTLRDSYRQTPDWIELHNAGDAAADLAGMHLSDDEDNLNKWSFPNGTTLGAGEYLVVFASGLDRVDDDGGVHTNFNLNASGDYVALSNASLEIISDLTGGGNYRDQFSDISFGVSNSDPQIIGYLTTPTPGAANQSEVVNIGPNIRAVTQNIDRITDSEVLLVTARVTDQYAATSQVTLTYRAAYGDDVTIAMTDDGQNGDTLANDETYSAVIPAGAAQEGQMLRWYVSAVDANGNTSRDPAFLDSEGEDQSPEYYGTVISNTAIDTQLPVFEWFLEPGTESRAGTRGGTRAAVYYDGEFYDNVFVRVRGGSSASLAKKSFKFDFNTANDFRFHPDHGRVTEINVNTTFTNKDYIRQALAFEVFDQAGVPGSEAFPIRVQQNGEFFSVAIMIEQPDAEMLQREGLDPNGALYKMYNRFESASGAEKRTREYESSGDLAEFASNVNRLEGEELRNYIFDNVNVPQVLNYLAATVIMQNNDQMAKNYFAYRDSDGTGEWSIFPWDLDLTFGLHFMSNDSILDDEIFADKDDFTTFAGVTIWPSHPFVGDEAHPANRSWNRLIDALYEVPEFRELHLRRLRTLMDAMLQSPETPANELLFEKRLDEYAEMIRSDVTLDYEKWANPWSYGEDYSLDEAMQRMKDLFFAVRREHLFETHSVNNLNPEPPTVVIPEFAAARYFVPGDDSLGTTWTTLDFDDTAWGVGETAIGFENTPRNYIDLIRTDVKPIDTVEGGTSIFMRIPFTVDTLA
ncbi:MAG: CotH kinase family protein, partial [Planctomycetales bacterium]|nr:CotH kinase family protein [Planctomycetales bacterium]